MNQRILLIILLSLPGFLFGQECYEKYKKKGDILLLNKEYRKAESHYKAARICDDCIDARLSEIEILIDSASTLRVKQLQKSLDKAEKLLQENKFITARLRKERSRLNEEKRKVDFALQEANRLSAKNDSLAKVNKIKAEASRLVGEAVTSDDKTLGLRLVDEAIMLSKGQSQIAKFIREDFISQNNNYYKYAFKGHYSSVSSLAISNKKKYLASGGEHTVKLWDLETGKEIRTFHNDVPILSIAFSPTGDTIITGGTNGQISIWNTKDGGKLFSAKENHNGNINAVTYSPDGNYFLSVGDDKKVILWNAKSFGVFVSDSNQEEHKNSITSVAFHPTRQVFLTGSKDSTAVLWEINYDENPQKPEIQKIKTYRDKRSNSAITSVAFLSTTDFILAGSPEGELKIWSRNNNRPIAKQKQHNSTISSIYAQNNFSSTDSAFIITGSLDKTIKLWTVKTPRKKIFRPRTAKIELKETFLGHEDNVNGVAVYQLNDSSDEKVIVSSSSDSTLKYWEVESLSEKREELDKPKNFRDRFSFLQKIVDFSDEENPEILMVDTDSSNKLDLLLDRIAPLSLSQKIQYKIPLQENECQQIDSTANRMDVLSCIKYFEQEYQNEEGDDQSKMKTENEIQKLYKIAYSKNAISKVPKDWQYQELFDISYKQRSIIGKIKKTVSNVRVQIKTNRRDIKQFFTKEQETIEIEQQHDLSQEIHNLILNYKEYDFDLESLFDQINKINISRNKEEDNFNLLEDKLLRQNEKDLIRMNKFYENLKEDWEEFDSITRQFTELADKGRKEDLYDELIKFDDFYKELNLLNDSWIFYHNILRSSLLN